MATKYDNIKFEYVKWVNADETLGWITLNYNDSIAILELDTRSMSIVNILCRDRPLMFAISRNEEIIIKRIGEILEGDEDDERLINIKFKISDFGK